MQIDNPDSKSSALSAIAEAYRQLEDEQKARELLQDTLQAAVQIDEPYYKSEALSAIAQAAGQLTNREDRQAIWRDTLEAAEAANAEEALVEIATQYAQEYDWGKALQALRHCPESQKVAAMAKILTLWAEKKNLRLIDGAVVLDVDVTGISNDYTFNVSLHSPTQGCEQYTDWWEVLDEDGELIYRQVFEKSHVDEQPFTSSSKPIKIQADQEVIVRAHMKNEGYIAMQALKGTVEKGFKSIRLPENFAANLVKAEPQPPECRKE
ncbi:MAG: hypothetical protein WA919_19300 [Coleofasciculaceae cyanobacterium]